MKNWILRYWLLMLGLLPLPVLAFRAYQGGAFEIMNPAGTLSTLAFVGCMSCTPLYLLIRQAWLLKLKRPLGVLAFGYGALHLLAYAVDLGTIQDSVNETLHKPSYLWGLAALLVMLPLALTSNKAAMKLLKRNWKRLQQASYAVVGLLIAHLLLLPHIKVEYQLFALILLAGLLMRLPPMRRLLNQRPLTFKLLNRN
ncbi:hypothetical protein EHF33_16025 [Deinococcus psychrotolerans]|uniref:Ferric oxidoreductase domain-containing protein n=1 Tax=Deinococcus psychrotolerans TaxID=2489213 RepID=A0A3G8YT09_9DEIO|nr:ferric reductase-like transmembrane domain-containing protein [Deinococcus psychrotolerans]AZI44386.1 hypothetical protein EHF33_16025 [Deinococcus psychrotolerans]